MASLCLPGAALAQEAKQAAPSAPAAHDSTDVAKKLANPIANMISVPFQWNYDRGLGADGKGSDQTLTIQPVIPIHLTEDVNLIVRPIATMDWQRNVDGHTGSGMNNFELETFFSPNTDSPIIWGIGPYLSLPAGSSGRFGSQQTGLGVTGVVLRQDGPWTYGVLGFVAWDVGGTDVSGTQNNIYYQPFIAYVTPTAWTFSLDTQSVYNRDLDRASTPINFTISKLVVTDKIPISYSVGIRYNASSLPGGPEDWGARASITFVLPEKK